MKFIDECFITVKAGNGGNGIVSFRREARVARGGPDGGDGGRGGHVYFVGDPGKNTLLQLKLMTAIWGNDGGNGKPKNAYGAAGYDKYIKTPIGTQVFSEGKLLFDITDEEPVLVAKGGKGGKGNNKFKSSRNTAPHISENGDQGEEYKFELILKVLADVGFVGKPSAGKSTLLTKISNAKPKVASYAFTTLTPHLGFVKAGDNSFVAADLPGLIEGASKGKGLGLEFLKHIERCKVIAHIVDMGDEEKNPIADYKDILNELESYDDTLVDRAHIVIANKSDLPSFDENLKLFKKEFPDIDVVSISGLTEQNITQLKFKVYETLLGAKEIVKVAEISETTIELEDEVVVTKIMEGLFQVEGAAVKRIYNKIPLNTNANFLRFNKLMKQIGVWEELEKAGVENGDLVQIFGYEFDWQEE